MLGDFFGEEVKSSIILNQPLKYRVVASRLSWILKIDKRDFYTYVKPKYAVNIFLKLESETVLKRHIQEYKDWLEFKEKIVEVPAESL